MPLNALSEEERRVVLECMRASIEGPFFPDWEFASLFGVARSDLARIVAAWPKLDEDAEEVALAINNSMNNLLGYPHGCERDWSRFLSVPPREVERIFLKWRAPSSPGRA
jgi:hypothetical protein